MDGADRALIGSGCGGNREFRLLPTGRVFTAC